ncbi:Asparagine synthase [Penicillium bovifimosum]|uniref:Asparagine synthase n=1 Tax=Penicillium bovifimosum TaxID=126998 RepID=A0A9W9H4U1_9EURO|nr:Asparagine synthase [Penicillium bovifimosum]KAJ5138665.1 Asparagine synthase [Penicillium bovifimosum]
MCGIFFSLSTSKPTPSTQETCDLLQKRGPDSYKTHTLQKDITTEDGVSPPLSYYLTFTSTVLALRGDHVYTQPLVDPATQSVLCWNGEAWKIAGERVQGNDTERVFNLFLQAVDNDRTKSVEKMAEAIASLSGPFAFVFYDAVNSRLYYSRDSLGRRSLLQGFDEDGNLKICSICDSASADCFKEVDTEGVCTIDLDRYQGPSLSVKELCQIEIMPWSSADSPPAGHIVCALHLFFLNTATDAKTKKKSIQPMTTSLPTEQPPALTTDSPFVKELESKLRQSLELRIQGIPEPPGYIASQTAKTAVLFSGGLDCTLLARLAHDILPLDEPIDLLNVAFENPRVAAAAAKANQTQSTPSLSIYENCPDRLTGRSAHAELQETCPGRTWHFIAVDIPYTETLAHREKVKRLMRPHNTEMDLSIACALYFAARGTGTIQTTPSPSHPESESQPQIYTTTSRTLLSGLGADELFAGYGRHSVAFTRGGFASLIAEIDLDVSRLGSRNLGRDDRVLSHWGRETRFPFLDEEFVAWVLKAPVWEKCGFGLPTPASEETAGIDAEKLALRLVAVRLGMRRVAREKKRAIQFGARTAKMETGRSRGTDALG